MTARSIASLKDRAAQVPVGANQAWSKLVILLLFLVLAVVFLIPLYWMVVSSFRPQSDLFVDTTDLTPTSLTADNYVRLFEEQPYARWFLNSVVQSLGFGALTVAVCTMAGYALAKYRFRGNNLIFFGVLVSQMIPFNLLIVSLFFIIIQLGLKETYWGAIIPLAASPIGLFFMRVYCISISDEMIDSARVDGASEYRIFWSIALPNLRPGLATLFILFTLEYWNNLLWPLIVFLKQENFPLAVGIASMVNSYRTQYDLVLAGSVLATVPIIVLFFILRRQFMEGASFTGTGVQ
jgi:ABC-type glycerol-3-phosphate transport system permease component